MISWSCSGTKLQPLPSFVTLTFEVFFLWRPLIAVSLVLLDTTLGQTLIKKMAHY